MAEKRFKYYRNNDGTSMIYDREQQEYYFCVDFDNICDILNYFYEENRRLKSQLCYNGSDVCDICKHQYLVKSENYYIAKCEKEHDECSKGYLKYCKDFDIKVKE